MITEILIQNCQKQHRDAQREVYEKLAPKLFLACKRYLKKTEDIEDVLAEAFFIIFTKINQLKEIKAFEGWARKITVNQCLLHIKKNVNFNLYLEESPFTIQPESFNETRLEESDLLKLLDLIPQGCKTIFNLFAIEGYSHKEIANMLQISEGTSKSQLNAAKNKLQHLVDKKYFLKTN